MCELNYRGTKIEIGLKLGDQKCNFTYKKWSLYKKPLRRWHVAVTCGIDTWSSTPEVNSQHPNRTSKTNFVGIYKNEKPNLWIKL